MSNEMTNQELIDLAKKHLSAIKPGAWEYEAGYDTVFSGTDTIAIMDTGLIQENIDNGMFIAAAPELVRQLVEALEKTDPLRNINLTVVGRPNV